MCLHLSFFCKVQARSQDKILNVSVLLLNIRNGNVRKWQNTLTQSVNPINRTARNNTPRSSVTGLEEDSKETVIS